MHTCNSVAFAGLTGLVTFGAPCVIWRRSFPTSFPRGPTAFHPGISWQSCTSSAAAFPLVSRKMLRCA